MQTLNVRHTEFTCTLFLVKFRVNIGFNIEVNTGAEYRTKIYRRNGAENKMQNLKMQKIAIAAGAGHRNSHLHP